MTRKTKTLLEKINEGPCASEQSLGNFVDMLVYHYDLGMYAIFHKRNNYWQQITKWYRYYGNLKRFNPEYNNIPMYYKYIYD